MAAGVLKGILASGYSSTWAAMFFFSSSHQCKAIAAVMLPQAGSLPPDFASIYNSGISAFTLELIYDCKILVKVGYLNLRLSR